MTTEYERGQLVMRQRAADACLPMTEGAARNRILALQPEAPASQPDTKAQPVAWTTRLALECVHGRPDGAMPLAFEVSPANLWGDKGIPLYAHPDSQPEGVVVPLLNEADRIKASRLISVLYNGEVNTHTAVEAGAMLQHLLSLAAAKEERDAQG